jgi:hypothetical protein
MAHSPSVAAPIEQYQKRIAASPDPLQRSEQYFTFSQSRAHFLRHANGRPHDAHIFCGRLALAGRSPFALRATA